MAASPVAEPDPTTARLAVVCAWCGQWRDGRDRWVPEAPARPDRVSHGICPACVDRMVREMS